MTDVVSKLKALGYRPLKDGAGKSSSHLEFSDQIGFPLPDDYRAFLSAFPETGVFDRQVAFSGSERSPWAADGREVLEVLYARCPDPSNDLFMLRTQYADQIPAHFLPIGQVTGANLLCLDLRNESLGQVYVWDHEHMDDARGGFYLVANGFSAFVDLLRALEQIQPKAGPKLVKKELPDTLKARVAELLKNKGN
ncbi:MAG: SMI1/KNR4 family protein [Betaproteobacteria bacterium]|nr:SMI1/KNR4 family protein [Betaproteobacteria bacterium]